MEAKKGISRAIKGIGKSLGTAAKRYPAAILLFITAAVLGMVLNHIDSPSEDIRRLFTSFIMASILGGAFSLSIKDIFEQINPRLRMKVFFWIVFGCFTLLYQMYLYGTMEGCEENELIRFAVLGLAAFVLYMTAVFRRGMDHREAYSTILGWRLAVTGIYTLVIWGGLSLLLFAVERLLNVNIEEKLYLDILIAAAGVFAPLFFLGGVPSPDDNPGPDRIYKFFRILVLYVVMPILAAYTAVFYIYALRILIIWQWPDGIVGNMVLWYAITGTLAMYFLRCMDGKSRWASIFGKWFPRIILLPVILLFISLGIRVSAYGVTANRYFLGATGAWVFVNMAYMSVVNYRERIARLMTISLVVIAFLSVVGPFNAFAAGRMSQTGRLESILESNGMLDSGGQVTAKPELDEKTKGEISSKLDYLEQCGGFKKVGYLPDGMEMKDMESIFGFSYTYYYEDARDVPGRNDYIFINREKTGGVVEVSGYDFMWDSDIYETTYASTEKGEFGFEFDRHPDGSAITVTLDGVPIFEKEAEEYIPSIKKAWEDSGGNPGRADLSFDESTDSADIRLIFISAEIYEEEEKAEYGWVRFVMLVKLK